MLENILVEITVAVFNTFGFILRAILFVIAKIIFYLEIPLRTKVHYDHLGLSDNLRVISGDNHKVIKIITDPDVIKASMDFFQQYHRWRRTSMIIPPVKLRYYSNDEFIFVAGIGKDYLMSGQAKFLGLWNTAKKSEIQRICEIVGLDSNNLEDYRY